MARNKKQEPPYPAEVAELITYRTEHTFRLDGLRDLIVGALGPGDGPGVVLDFRVGNFENHETKSELMLRLSKGKARALASSILAVAAEQ